MTSEELALVLIALAVLAFLFLAVKHIESTDTSIHYDVDRVCVPGSVLSLNTRDQCAFLINQYKPRIDNHTLNIAAEYMDKNTKYWRSCTSWGEIRANVEMSVRFSEQQKTNV